MDRFLIAAVLGAGSLATASAQTVSTSTPQVLTGGLVAELIQSAKNSESSFGWDVAAVPCSTLNEGQVDSAWCMNVLGTPGSVGYYFDQNGKESTAIGVAFMNATLAMGSGYSTSERLYMKVDPGAQGGGDVERIQLDNSATVSGIWLGVWLGGYGDTLDDAAVRISSGNSDGSAAWKTGISLSSTWNTSLSEGSVGGPSGFEIGGNHQVGILSDASATYSQSAIVMPSDPVSPSIEGLSWWSDVVGSGTGNSAISATDLSTQPCGLCISTQASSSGSSQASSQPVFDVRFRRGGGISTEAAVGIGLDANANTPAAWSEALVGEGVGTVALRPSGGAQGVLTRLLALGHKFSVSVITTCVGATTASEVETDGAYEANGTAIWEINRVITGSATVAQTLTKTLTATSALASASLGGSGQLTTSCAAEARFGDLP